MSDIARAILSVSMDGPVLDLWDASGKSIWNTLSPVGCLASALRVAGLGSSGRVPRFRFPKHAPVLI